MTARLELAQALELSQLVEMEAGWENLRRHPAQQRLPREDLIEIQRSYEAFHTKLLHYNGRHTPQHVSELLLNTADRLGRWCANMSILFRRVEADPKARCPVHLVEKAYRRAEAIARRMNYAPITRRSPPGSIPAAIEELEAVRLWCAALPQSPATAKPHLQATRPMS